MIEFKGVHSPKSVILHPVLFYLQYAVAYRDFEGIVAERGVTVDHKTLNHWVEIFSPVVAARAKAGRYATTRYWRRDETYIKVEGMWTYLYCAADRDGQTLEFMRSDRRGLVAARRFFSRTIDRNEALEWVVIDMSDANLAGLQTVNVLLKFTAGGRATKVRQVKFLNNIVEQGHRFIKRTTGAMKGFKALHLAEAAIAGIEAARTIRKG